MSVVLKKRATSSLIIPEVIITIEAILAAKNKIAIPIRGEKTTGKITGCLTVSLVNLYGWKVKPIRAFNQT